LSLVLMAAWAIYLNLAPSPAGMVPQSQTVTPAAPAPAPTLRLLVWRNILDPQLLADFETETGLKIVREDYDTNEQLVALMDGGRITHDVVLVSGIDLKHMLDRDLLQPLPPGTVANRAGLDPTVVARIAAYDAGGTYAAPAAWGTVGLAYDAAKIADRLGPDVAVDSWGVLFAPETAAKIATCGIQVVDSPRGVFPIALTYLGLPPDSAKAEDTEAATRAWETIRPSIAKFNTQDVAEGLAEGRTCFALATSGDAYRARVRAKTVNSAAEIRYVIPKEGSIAWFALAAIPKGAADAAGGQKLIDYLLRPQVAARLTNASGLANAVRDSALYIQPELKADTTLLPAAAAAARFILETEPSEAAAALRNRFWQLINAPPALPPPPPPPAAPPP
jgi:putrescine transport system substrate-binding protein